MAEEKDWTVIVYLAGDNNLSEEMLYSLKEMKLAGSNPQVNVIAMFDPNEPELPTQRFILNASGEPGGLLTHDLIDTDEFHAVDPEVNAADPDVIAEFMFKGIKLFPARHYMVVLSGHGPGEVDNAFLLTDDDPGKGAFPGNQPINPQTALRLADLNKIFVKLKEKLQQAGLSEGQPGVKAKIDILGMDSCLTNCAEVCLQLGEHVDFVVGPQGFEPNLGWPYRQVLARLMEDSKTEPAELAVRVVDEYVRYYYDYVLAGRSVDMSACNLQNAPALLEAVKGLTVELRKSLPITPPDGGPDPGNAVLNALILAHWESQGFKFDQFADLYDFCDRLERRCQMSADIQKACRAVKGALRDDPDADKRFVLKSCTSGPAFQYANGLSVFLPWGLDTPADYQNLIFPQQTNWHLFVNEYVRNSRRSTRPGDDVPLPPGFDSPTKNRGTDKPGTMKNPPQTWKMSPCLKELVGGDD
ncbi:MAG TPA: clostripain-related cysteine peptidase [Pyrinomonadaceae bacterium]|nr:clostripain-related cysteine peptidase [Pyrinomonadaceae bacterium]